MRQATGLRRHFVRVDQPRQAVQDRDHGLHGIRSRIHADHCISAAVEQALKRCEQNPADVIRRMVRLRSNSQHAALAHRISAACDVSNLRGGQDQVLVAHDFRHCRCDLRNDSAAHALQLRLARSVIKQQFAKLAHRKARDFTKRLAVIRVENHQAHIILIWINHRSRNNFRQRQIRQLALCRHALPL